MGTEDEGLKGVATTEMGTTMSFFWKIAAEIISEFNFSLVGLEERGSPKRGLFSWWDFPAVKEDIPEFSLSSLKVSLQLPLSCSFQNHVHTAFLGVQI